MYFCGVPIPIQSIKKYIQIFLHLKYAICNVSINLQLCCLIAFNIKKELWHDLYAFLGSTKANVKNTNLCLLANYVITPKTKVIYCPPMGIIRHGQKGFCINKELLIIVSLSQVTFLTFITMHFITQNVRCKGIKRNYMHA